MDFVLLISISLKVVLLLIALYIFAMPEKVVLRKPSLTIAKVRLLSGAAISFLLFGAFLQFGTHSAPSPSELTQDQKALIAKLEFRLQVELSKYPAEIQKSRWTRSCQKSNVEQELKISPNLPVSTAELIGLTACSCMAKILAGSPEFKKSEESIAAGKEFTEALDAAYEKVPNLAEKIKPCQGLGT